MAYSESFLKITWIFGVDNSDEMADTGLNLAYTTVTPDPIADLALITNTTIQDLATAYGTMMTAASSTAWASYSHITSVKVAAIGTDGHYLTDPRQVEVTGPAGTNNGVHPQLTQCVSLRSGGTIGKGNYGRMYLPHTMLGLPSGDPRSTAAHADELASAAGIFVEEVVSAINDDIDGDVYAAIMSQAAPPSSKTVTQIAVGRVTDTQRRRRNRLVEDYQFATVSP